MAIVRLSCRYLSNFAASEALAVKFSSRGPADNEKKTRQPLTFNDVDIVYNPSEKLIDQFMNGYGKQRLNFKRNDIEIWRECFQDRYRLMFTCLKSDGKIIQTLHVFDFPPLNPQDRPHQFEGFLWIDKEYRGADSAAFVDYNCKKELRNVCENPVAQTMPQSVNIFNKMFGNARTGYTLNVSYYKPDEIKIPAALDLEGITLKSAREVPDSDIVKYDNSIFPYERSRYILKHLRDPAGFGKVAYDKNGNVIGFGALIIYPSGECVLTPLYADSTQVAQAIFKSILQEMPLNDKKLLRFHIRSIDQCNGMEWIQPFLKCTPRKDLMAYLMYTDTAPSINYSKVFVNAPYTTCAI
uniref:DUF1248 domain-containing protein n=1 Tax=Caenorhabditis japonica TaxID=281687 RepID=A0A8R1DK40_CAEJA